MLQGLGALGCGVVSARLGLAACSVPELAESQPVERTIAETCQRTDGHVLPNIGSIGLRAVLPDIRCRPKP